MAEVTFTRDVAVKGKDYKAGQKAEFPSHVAAALVEQGKAKLTPAPAKPEGK